MKEKTIPVRIVQTRIITLNIPLSLTKRQGDVAIAELKNSAISFPNSVISLAEKDKKRFNMKEFSEYQIEL